MTETHHQLEYLKNCNKQTINYINQAIEEMQSNPRLAPLSTPLGSILQGIIDHMTPPITKVEEFLSHQIG